VQTPVQTAAPAGRTETSLPAFVRIKSSRSKPQTPASEDAERSLLADFKTARSVTTCNFFQELHPMLLIAANALIIPIFSRCLGS
jgi:hypothetical protein